MVARSWESKKKGTLAASMVNGLNGDLKNLRCCVACISAGLDCPPTWCDECMKNEAVCGSCAADGHGSPFYFQRHCRSPSCTATCVRFAVAALSSDHEAHQQKLLKALHERTGYETTTPAGQTIRLAFDSWLKAIGDPPHTVKLWRSGMHWNWLLIPDLLGNRWFVSLILILPLLVQNDAAGVARARAMGFSLAMVRNKDRMSVGMVSKTARAGATLEDVPVGLTVITVVPSPTFWKSNQKGAVPKPCAVAVREEWSLIITIDCHGRLFRLSTHSPMDVSPVALSEPVVGATGACFVGDIALVAAEKGVLVIDMSPYRRGPKIADFLSATDEATPIFSNSGEVADVDEGESGVAAEVAAVPAKKAKRARSCLLAMQDSTDSWKDLDLGAAGSICAGPSGGALVSFGRGVFVLSDFDVVRLLNGGLSCTCNAEMLCVAEGGVTCMSHFGGGRVGLGTMSGVYTFDIAPVRSPGTCNETSHD